MAKDKSTAVWVSHSSISDFLECPRAYYLKNIYRNPATGNKIQIMTPPLALGQAVHEVVESLSVLETEKRFETPLLERFEEAWENVGGKQGGFLSNEAEKQYKRRGEDMLRRIMKNPGPITKLAVKIQMDLPQYWISEEDNIILCGKIDWLEFIEESKAVHIIDFKTGKRTVRESSLQLPIYLLLVTNTQNHPVEKVSYWYLGMENSPTEQKLPNIDKSREEVLKIAKKIKLARQLESFNCPHGEKGCRSCKPLEAVVDGKGELVGVGGYGNDIFVMEDDTTDDIKEGAIL